MDGKCVKWRLFLVFQWEEEAAWLRRQHQNGWKLTSVKGLAYHFEACEPEDVVYQLDYNPDGLQHKDEYVKLFEDCGWEYLQDLGGYSYFRKPASAMSGDEEGIFCDEEGIFCDDESRMDMIHRVWKGRGITCLILFLLMIVQLPNNMDSVLVMSVIIPIIVLYAALLIYFADKYRRMRKRLRK